MNKRERKLQEALKLSITALDDWINTYASEFCDKNRVQEAHKRILDQGGTLAYIADIQKGNREALGEKKKNPPLHCCGAQGFGVPGDVCPGCQANYPHHKQPEG